MKSINIGVTGGSNRDLSAIVNAGVTITDTELLVGANLHTSLSGLFLAGQSSDVSVDCPIKLSNGFGEDGYPLLSAGENSTPRWGTSTIDDSIQNYLDSAGKTAIVPSVNGDYVDLYCVESPDVRFEDVVSIKVNGRLKIEQEIDPEFVFVCEQNSIKAVSHTTTEPALCGVKVRENKLIITFSGNIPEEVTVKLSGTKKRFCGRKVYS